MFVWKGAEVIYLLSFSSIFWFNTNEKPIGIAYILIGQANNLNPMLCPLRKREKDDIFFSHTNKLNILETVFLEQDYDHNFCYKSFYEFVKFLL